MAKPGSKPLDIVAQLEAVAAKDPVARAAALRGRTNKPQVSSASPLLPSSYISSLLKGIDSDPFVKNPSFKKDKPSSVPPALSALKNVLLPLQVLDTPRRAVISGVRELVDAMDSDPTTKASFSDFSRQTKDFHYGFGTAFPMKGWAGRILGFVGDVALDPLTYATLGGTVVGKKLVRLSAAELSNVADGGIARLGAKELSDLGIKKIADDVYETSARSAIFGTKKSGRAAAKSVTGREGRFKLADFVQKRMEWSTRNGLADYSPEEIASVFKNISSQGKMNIPDSIARELGIRGPGVYYFGSRLKVPGTDIVGKLIERGITRVRLGAVRTSGIEALQKAITPRGVGAIEYFGPGTIKKYRIALANGSLSDNDAQLGRSILNADDVRRISYSQAEHQAETRLSALREVVSLPENANIRYLLDNVETGDMAAEAAKRGISGDQLRIAQELRVVLDDLHKVTDDGWQTVVPDHVLGFQRGYVPHSSTERFLEWLDTVDPVIRDANYVPDSSNLHIVGNFRERRLRPGSAWFGNILEQSDLNIDTLNEMAFPVLGFNAFETDMSKILSAYVRGHSNMMANVGMMNSLKENPNIVKLMDGYMGVAPEYVEQMHVASAKAFDAVLESIQNLHSGLRDSLNALGSQLEKKYTSLSDALSYLRSPGVTQADLDDLRRHLTLAIADASTKYYEMIRLQGVVGDMLPNVDGFAAYSVLATKASGLSEEFQRLTNVITNFDQLEYVSPQQLAGFLEDFASYEESMAGLLRSQASLMQAASYLGPLSTYSRARGTIYEEVIKIVTTLNKEKVPNPFVSTSGLTLDDVEIGLASLIPDTAPRDVSKSVDYGRSLSSFLYSRYPDMSERIDELVAPILANLNRVPLKPATQGQIDSLSKAATASSRRASERLKSVEKVRALLSRADFLQKEIDFNKSQIEIAKKRVSENQKTLKNAQKNLKKNFENRKVSESFSTGSQSFVRNVADSKAALQESELLLVELREDLSLSYNKLYKMNRPELDKQLASAQKRLDAANLDYSKKQSAYLAAKNRSDDVLSVESDYRDSLYRMQRIVAQLKTSVEVSHLREVFAYYGIDIGDSLVDDILKKNFALIDTTSKGSKAGLVDIDPIFSREMDVLDLRYIANRIEGRLEEARRAAVVSTPKVKPARPAGKSVAPVVTDPETASRRSLELTQSLNHDLAKSAKNNTDALLSLSPLNGTAIDWTFGGRVAPPKVSAMGRTGGDFDLQFPSDGAWESLFRESMSSSRITTSISDWANSEPVLDIIAPGWQRSYGGEKPSNEASLNLFVQYQLALGGEVLSPESVSKRRYKFVLDSWRKSDEYKTFKELDGLDASLVVDDIINADVVRIEDAQKVILDSIDNAESNLAASVAEAAEADEMVPELVIDRNKKLLNLLTRPEGYKPGPAADVADLPVESLDPIDELKNYTDALKQEATDEQELIAKLPTSSFGDVDADINDVTFDADIGLGEDFRALNQAARLRGVVDVSGPSSVPVTPDFEFNLMKRREASQRLETIFDSGTLETKTVAELEYEISLLQRMIAEEVYTDGLSTSSRLRSMIKARQAALEATYKGPDTSFARGKGLPVSVKIARKQKTSMGVKLYDSNGKPVMVDDIRPSVIGTFRKYEDGRIFLRKEDMSVYEGAAYWQRARAKSGEWVEIRWRPIQSAEDNLLTVEQREALGWFPVGDDSFPPLSRRWMKPVEFGDELWDGSEVPYGMKHTLANNFGGEIEAVDPDSFLAPLAPILEDPFPTVKVPKTGLMGDEEAFSKLQRDLDSIVSSGSVDSAAVAAASRDADDLVRSLQNQFDSVKDLVKPDVDPADIAQLENRISAVLEMMRRTGKSVGWDPNIKVNKTGRFKSSTGDEWYNATLPIPSGRTRVRNRIAGTSPEARAYEHGLKTLEEGIEMLRTLGKRGNGFAHLEQIAQNQIRLETEFLAAASVLADTEVEQRLLAGLQNSILRMEQGGQVFDVASNAPVGSFASSNTSKFFPELTNGWRYLGEKYPGLAGSPEFATLWETALKFDDPDYLRSMQKYVGSYTKFFKAYATMTPGFHVRNGIANAFKLVFMGAQWRNMMDATPIYVSWMKASARGVLWDDFILTQPAEIRNALVIARKSMYGSGGGIFTNDFKDAVGGSWLWDNKLVRFNAKWGQASDNYSRFVLGFDSARSGMDVGMAQARVKKAFFDYEDLSEVDAVMRQFVPFWLWTSRNLVFELQNQWLNPKPYQIYRSFMRNLRDDEYEEEEYPSRFIREMGGIKLPFGGNNLYLAPDLGFTRTEQQLEEIFNPIRYGNNLNPLLKVPLEQFLGKSIFTGKEMDTSKERLIHILKGFAPPVQQGDRLFGSEGDAAKNAWLSTFGSPIRTYQTKEK